MISAEALQLGVERGVISADQAEALRVIDAEAGLAALETTKNEPRDRPDDEALRFITGFADIFVTIGIALFTGALGYLVDQAFGLTVAAWAVAAAAWVLAEFFTRRRRMALPSIALMLVFAGAAMLGLVGMLAGDGSETPVDPSDLWHTPTKVGFVLTLIGLGAVALIALHYWRFRVPITIAAGMAALLVAAEGALAGVLTNASDGPFYGLALVWGVLTFLLAMRFDLSDPARATRRTDIAFWLHLLAAPLIVHALVHGFLPDFMSQPTVVAAVSVLVVFVVLALLALVIDRRAILVSGLVYAGIAFGTLIRNFGLTNVSLLLPIVVLALGALILLLSAGWHPLRRFVLACLPAGLASRLPHPMVSSST